MPEPAKPIERRRYILQHLLKAGEISYKDIFAQFDGVARQSIKDDVDFLTDLGFAIEAEKRGREIALVLTDNQSELEGPDTAREPQKMMIASLASGFICGFGQLENEVAEFVMPEWCRAIHSKSEVLNSCRADGPAEQHWNGVVLPALEDFWLHRNRIVAIDAGSTNLRTARLLKDVRVPCEFSHLTSLAVCTNGRKMFNELGDESVRIRTIVVGGQQIRSTSIIGGRLAEQFLGTASSLHFAVSLIGAISLNIRDRSCRTSTQEEIGMKSLFMQKSSLKVVCLDDKKIAMKPYQLMRSGFNFTTVGPSWIDLIITNRPLTVSELPADATSSQREAAIREEEEGIFDQKIYEINKLGVPCLVAKRGPVVSEADLFSDMTDS